MSISVAVSTVARPIFATVRCAPSGSVLRTSESKRISAGPIGSNSSIGSARCKMPTVVIETSSKPSTSATKAEASAPVYESETRRATSSWATSAIDLAGSEIIVPPKLLPESAITFIEVTSFDELTVANNATGVLGIVRVFTLFTFVPLPELRTEL